MKLVLVKTEPEGRIVSGRRRQCPKCGRWIELGQDLCPRCDTKGASDAEVFVQDPEAPFGAEGLENPDDPVRVKLIEHRVVAHGIRGPGGGFSHLAQFQGTSPFSRRLDDTTPIFEYFTARIEE